MIKKTPSKKKKSYYNLKIPIHKKKVLAII